MIEKLWFFYFGFSFINIISCTDPVVHPCTSEIYCHGPLLHTIQMAKLYEDSKTFVDMKLKYPPKETLKNFHKFMIEFKNKPNQSEIYNFVSKNFDSAGKEFEFWHPNDWVEHPKFTEKIQDISLQKFALELNDIWKHLGRKIKKSVKDNSELYSIIWVPNPAIVPGGRFREFYYWDSYWIIMGLLLSEMVNTTKGMLENFLYMVENYGLIPNGGRLYYLQRSQPPLLIPMIKQYYDTSKDVEFLKNNILIMEKEFDFWLKNHTVTLKINEKNYTLAHYGDKSQGPRPESYSEDVKSAMNLNGIKKEAFYSELKAGAESGWDFSSRWFISNGTNNGNLTDIKTRSIIPVDLNSILYWNAFLLGEFNEILNNKEKSSYYYEKAKLFKEAVHDVLWDEDEGIWLDYDIINKKRRNYFYPSNIAPLWTGCYDISQNEKITKLVLKYLRNKNVMIHPGGIAASLRNTGEQWDFPNAWPPLQHMMIVALNNTGEKSAQRLAFEIARKWIRSNYKAYQRTNSMLEKYDVTVSGSSGGGGEYKVQEGFGWTNGVILDLLDKYGDVMYVNDPIPYTYEAVHSSSNTVTTALIALIVSLTAGFIGIIIYRRRISKIKRKTK